MKLLALLAAAAIVIGGAWYLAARPSARESATPEVAIVSEEAKKEIEVTKTDITQSGVSKLPVGFPSDIPVEVSNIRVIQYTVSYTSFKSKDALWTTYSDFMKSAGFEIEASATSKSLGQISGTKDGDSLSIVVSSHSGVTLAQINLLDRQ
jgi:hypothetical protein